MGPLPQPVSYTPLLLESQATAWKELEWNRRANANGGARDECQADVFSFICPATALLTN